jgi:hypothetical protein
MGLCLALLLLSPLTRVFAKDSEVESVDAGSEIPVTSLKRTDAFYDSLKARTDRYWFLRQLYPTVFSTDSVETVLRVDDPDFENWRGMIIRSIRIARLEIFPPDSTEWNVSSYSLMARMGNGTHLNAREWVIRENLFFREGDQLVPGIMRRNLIFLRKVNYLGEADILVVSPHKDADSVDVLVVTRDKFTIKPGGRFATFSNFRVSLDDSNFLGLGRRLRTGWRRDPDYPGSEWWECDYSIPNICGTFIGGELAWANLPGTNLKSAAMNRPFLYPVKRFAGGADIAETRVIAPADTTTVDRVVLGGWCGYSFHGRPGPANQYRYVALSLEQTWLCERPEVGPNLGKLWHESLLALGALAITQSDYRRLPYTQSFLQNEDTPVGFLLEFLAGHEFGEFRDREFLGLHGAWGEVLDNGGYSHLSGGVETFFGATGPEQGVLALEPLYLTPLKELGSVRGRTLCRGRVILGHKRFPGETLRLSTDPYFRGEPSLVGAHLLTVGMEKDYMMPWGFLGFHFTVFGSIDGALVTDALFHPAKDDLLLTEGIGFRLRNPRMVWNSLEFIATGNQSVGHKGSIEFALSTKVPLKPVDFEGRRPRPYLFR